MTEEALTSVALFATANTVFITLIVTSRMIYGMSRDGAFPRSLGRISPKRGTPTVSIILVMLVTVGMVFFQDLTFVANATVFAILIAFAFVNLSLIVLRRREPTTRRPFRASPSVGTVPVTALLGAGVCVGLLFTFEPLIVATQGIIIVVGIVIYCLLGRKAQQASQRRARQGS